MEASCNTGTCLAGSARDTVEVSWVEFSVLDVLIPPPVLDAVIVTSPTSLHLEWSEPADVSQVLSYDIERNQTSGFQFVANVPNGTTTYLDENLTPDTDYTYRLFSVGSSANSTFSNEITQMTTIVLMPTAFAVPDSDPTVRWLNGVGNPPCSDLLTFNCVDEIFRDDLDFIQTINLGDGGTDTQFYTLSDISDPEQNFGHVLKYTLREANLGTNPVAFDIELRQGVTSIAKFSHQQGSLPAVNYVLFERFLNSTQADSITDYNDLELTLTASCSVGCTNQNREKVHVSFVQFAIDQARVPSSLTVLTLDQDELSQMWEAPTFNGSSPITGYQIQREDCGQQACTGNFQNIANLTDLNFIDSGLASKSLFQYQVRSNNSEGLSAPSFPQQGQTSAINITEVSSTGGTLEPSATHSFTKNQVDTIISAIEFAEPDTNNLDEMIVDLRSGLLPLYQIILKMDNGTYGFDLGMINGTEIYGDEYVSRNDLLNWFANIEQTVKVAVGAGL